MRLENQYLCLAQPLELEGASTEEFYRRSKAVYTREFLLSCAELHECKQVPAGFDPSIFRPSKRAYTREFLLSCADLDICKQLLKGFDLSALHELKEGFKGILEPWKGSGVLVLPPNSGNSIGKAFTELDYYGSTGEPVERSDSYSWRWSRESNYKENYNSDFNKRDDLTRSLAEISQFKAKDMGKMIKETEQNDYYQLSKSENPYRPPHTYQVCKSKFEEESLSKETADTEKAEYGIQEEKLLEEYRLAEDNQHEIHETTISAEDNSCGSVCFVKPSCYDFNFSEPNVTRNNETTQLDSKKANMSTISDELHEAQSRMIPKDDIAISFKNTEPQHCEAIPEEKVGVSDETSYPVHESLSSMLKNPSEASSEYFHTDQCQPCQPISEMEFDELLSNRGFYSCQRGSFNNIVRDVSEPYEFPFTIAYDLFSSVLDEHNPIKNNHQTVTTAAAADRIELYDMERDECTFDDMWSEILEILQFEREMDLRSAAELDQTASFKAQISLPEQDNLISIDYPTNSEYSKFVPSNSSYDVACYDAEIHLPNEDHLITIDDLIAPEDRLISIDCPTSAELPKFVPLNSSCDAVDNVEIQLPDKDSLITIDDLIAPNQLRSIASGRPAVDDAWMSDGKEEVAREMEALVISDPVEQSATQPLEVPPSTHLTASMAYQEPKFWHSSLHNRCSAINPEMTMCYPLDPPEAQMRLQTTLVGRVPIHCYPALHRHFCTNKVHQYSRKTASLSRKTASPKLKELSYPLVQYSLLDQPTSFPMKGLASCIWDEKTQLFPPRHQLTLYPGSTMTNSGEIFASFFFQ